MHTDRNFDSIKKRPLDIGTVEKEACASTSMPGLKSIGLHRKYRVL